jgi:phosphatidylinositol 4-kinase B
MKLIPNKEEKPNNWLGSLYNLFNSEYFDVHLLLYYLDKKDEQGIVDVLMNIMNKNFINESFFYIPQLCTMITYKPYYESLENYILDRCVDQMKFSLKIYWLINSYTESAEEYKIIKKYDKLVQRIEMTLVNGRRATISSFKLYNSLNIKSEEEVYKHSLDKEFRLTYFEKTNKFYQELKSMCEKLKDYPKENKLDPKMTRNAVMRKHLLKFNKNIRSMFSFIDENTKTTTKSLYRGFILPFDDATSTMDDYNSLIVNFLPEYSFCFSTKARVPVKITVECVRVLECAYWDELVLEGNEQVGEDLNMLEDDEEEQAANLQTEENNKIEATHLNNSGGDNTNYYSGGQNIEMVPMATEVKVNEYSSIEDFFKKVSNNSVTSNNNSTPKLNSPNSNPFSPNSQMNAKEKKEKEIKNIVDNIKQANENEYFSNIRMSMKKDSVLSELTLPAKEENFLYDDSEETINPFGARWSDSIKKIKEKSRFRNFETYSVKSFIAKANDDLRQEVMTMQLIKRFDDVFKQADIPLKLRPYEILITSPSSGLIEFLPNTISIDALKKNLPDKWNLNIFFRKFFTNNFEEAQKNFAESLAAYSIITYMIAIRDRHNGNILLDMNGNLIHIDFGFILGISPGNLNFENAPFKLTQVRMILFIIIHFRNMWIF